MLPLVIHAQTNPQTEVIVKNAKGESVFAYLPDTPDPDIKNLPKEITAHRVKDPVTFIRLLAEYITEKSSNDYERVKKAHDWVALNIKYDTESYFSGRYASQDFNAVIKRGYAVCAGYADVFKYLCDALEIKCRIVSGYARWNIGREIFKNHNVFNTNHAWNIVTIEGENYLIDSTWNAGYLNGKNYVIRYKTDYLFVDPSLFIYDHFSEKVSDQLLDPPVSAEEFNNLFFVRPTFFKVFETWPDLVRINEIVAGENVTYEFTLKEGYDMSYGWYTQLGVQSGSTSYPGRMDVYKITVPNLKPGKYFLRISVKKNNERTYWSCAEFGFVVKDKD
ncbi:MAG: hypothetical protein FWF38_04520 [Spirochaetaceae bacterium]|nr:hypothetical protein [Spirochaetaceae bacterium]